MTSQGGDMTMLHDRIETAAVPARSALGASAPWKEAVVKGIALAYDDMGRGDEIVCLHAIGHGARDFERLRHRFGRGYRVVALDWPGHGNSGPDGPAASAERYLELLIDFMDAAGFERPVIVGNSIGGAVAIRYAAERPDRVRGLILENPGGLYRSDRLSRIAIAAMVRFFSAGARRAWWFPAAYRAYYRTVLPMREAAQQRSRVTAAGTRDGADSGAGVEELRRAGGGSPAAGIADQLPGSIRLGEAGSDYSAQAMPSGDSPIPRRTAGDIRRRPLGPSRSAQRFRTVSRALHGRSSAASLVTLPSPLGPSLLHQIGQALSACGGKTAAPSLGTARRGNRSGEGCRTLPLE